MNADDDWFETLGGRKPRAADRLAAAEAAMLRAALRHQQTLDAEPAAQPPLPPLQLPQPPRSRAWHCRSCAERWQRLRSAPWAWLGAGAAALAAVLATTLLLQSGLPGGRDRSDDETLRGAASAPAAGLRVVPVADPQRARDGLADRLAAAGVEVRRYQRLGRHGLQAQWQGELPAALQAELRGLGVQVSVGMPLQIEFEASPP